MDPYNLLLELRENKILYSYMNTVAVYVDEDDSWIIIGDSNDGELRINQTNTDVLRVALPIEIPSPLPDAVVNEILVKLQEDLDALLKIEVDIQFGHSVLYYYIHITLPNKRGLDKALIQFAQDRRSIKNVFSDLIRSVASLKNSMMDNLKSSQSSTPQGSKLWDEIQELDNKFNDDSSEEEENS